MRFPAAGDYRFAFYSFSGFLGRYRGPYRFWTYTIDRSPEHQPPTVAIDSEVRGESIDRAGDVDEFAFSGLAGLELNAFLQSSHPFQLEIAPPGGNPIAILRTGGSTDTSLFHLSTGRFQIPAPGTYLVRVFGISPTMSPIRARSASSCYPIDRRPESVAAAISPGDTINGESIDRSGDVDEFTFRDEFTLTGSPGQLAVILGRTIDPAPAGYPLIAVFDSISTDTVAWLAAQGFDKPSDYFTIPASGRLKIAVYHPAVGFGGDFLGDYQFKVVAVNPAPETAPATFSLGDTISLEAVFPTLDVDEFTSTATPGDTWYRPIIFWLIQFPAA